MQDFFNISHYFFKAFAHTVKYDENTLKTYFFDLEMSHRALLSRRTSSQPL